MSLLVIDGKSYDIGIVKVTRRVRRKICVN